MASLRLQEVITAHDGDVLAMCFSEMNSHGEKYYIFEILKFTGVPELFASGGRDGLIHIFLPSSPYYTHCGVVEEHAASISTLMFVKVV